MGETGRRVVLVADPSVEEAIKLILSPRFDLVTAHSGPEVVQILGERRIDGAVIHRSLSGDVGGEEACWRIREACPGIPVTMISGGEFPVDVQVRAMHLHVNLMAKPLVVDTLRQQLGWIALGPELVGNDARFLRALEEAKRFAAFDEPLLIVGETGTGKSVLASLIHRWSARRYRPFVVVPAPEIAESLAESTFFGHETGAFTGAASRRAGYFERAHGGTLFLDDLEDLSPRLQAKLLRVAEEGRFLRIGGTEEIAIGVRLIAAVKSEPRELVKSGALREDLLQRLSALTVRLPPLRERGEDVMTLACLFRDKVARKHGLTTPNFTPECLARMRGYEWPGNARELLQVVKQAVLLGRSPISVNDLPKETAGGPAETLDEKLWKVTEEAVREAWEKTGGNMAKMSLLLLHSRPIVRDWVKRAGLQKK